MEIKETYGIDKVRCFWASSKQKKLGFISLAKAILNSIKKKKFQGRRRGPIRNRLIWRLRQYIPSLLKNKHELTKFEDKWTYKKRDDKREKYSFHFFIVLDNREHSLLFNQLSPTTLRLHYAKKVSCESKPKKKEQSKSFPYQTSCQIQWLWFYNVWYISNNTENSRQMLPKKLFKKQK